MPPEPRTGLGARRPRRPHPASPEAASEREKRPVDSRPAAPPGRADTELVMLCVRVTPSLRRRLKLAAASCGQSVQAIATDALDAACKQHDM